MELLFTKVENIRFIEKYIRYGESFVRFECDTNCWNLKKHETITLKLKDYISVLKNGYYYN